MLRSAVSAGSGGSVWLESEKATREERTTRLSAEDIGLVLAILSPLPSYCKDGALGRRDCAVTAQVSQKKKTEFRSQNSEAGRRQEWRRGTQECVRHRAPGQDTLAAWLRLLAASRTPSMDG